MIVLTESAKLRALRALVPYVPSDSRASCPTCFRVLSASCPTCSQASCSSCPTCSCALRASCPTCSHASRASCLTYLLLYMPRAKRAFMSHVSCVLLYLTCFVPFAFSGCLELYLRALLLLVPHLLQVFQA